jgi:hypothetical protein
MNKQLHYLNIVYWNETQRENRALSVRADKYGNADTTHYFNANHKTYITSYRVINYVSLYFFKYPPYQK